MSTPRPRSPVHGWIRPVAVGLALGGLLAAGPTPAVEASPAELPGPTALEVAEFIGGDHGSAPSGIRDATTTTSPRPSAATGHVSGGTTPVASAHTNGVTSSLTPSHVQVTLRRVRSHDRVTVKVGAGMVPVTDRTQKRSWVCVSASRTETRTETRRGQRYRITTRQREKGCRNGTPYEFNQATWQARAGGSIPTVVRTTVTERGPHGTRVVSQRSRRSSTAVNVRWSGTGDPRPQAWTYPPGICYDFPPIGCPLRTVYRSGAGVSRASTVSGSVYLRGLSTTVRAPKRQRGAMRWWVGGR